ncbi:MAG: hypothetical protein Q9210_005481, partial [Variospora velana]
MFDKNLSAIKLEPDFGSQLDAVQSFILLFRMMKDTDFQEMFDITNNRVYSAFAAIDQAIQDQKMARSNGTPLPHDWAAEYQKWLEAYLNRISGPVWMWTWDKWTDLQRRHQTFDSEYASEFFDREQQVPTAYVIVGAAVKPEQGRTSKELNVGTWVFINHAHGIFNVDTAVEPEEGTAIRELHAETWVFIDLEHSTIRRERPTTSYCSGNQIDGACQQAVHPSASPNSGPLPPVCAKVSSKTGPLRINSSKARRAAQDFCHILSSKRTVLDSEHTAVRPWIVHAAAEHGGDLALSAIYDTEACSVGKKIELSKAGEMECYRNFFEYISQLCTQDPTWKAVYDPEHTLEGGT